MNLGHTFASPALPAPPADADDAAAVVDWWVSLALAGNQATIGR